MNDLDKHILKIINEELTRKDSAYNIRKSFNYPNNWKVVCVKDE